MEIPDNVSREFVIQPNCSLSDQGRKYFLWSMGVVMLGISGGMMTTGLWLVVPFMGVEWLVLVYVFDKVGKQCRVVERVRIDHDELTVHHEEPRHPSICSFPLYWVNVDLRQAKHPWYRTQLLIGAHGRWVELAAFLNNEERASLASAIRTALMTERQPQ